MKVVFFDHRQRGAASTEDAAFVQRLAAPVLECDTHVWRAARAPLINSGAGGADAT